ncbi:unnamed protein product [Schistosoma mattheei]|uniref:Uncharacterized protein n=1 Tax=Schistosoma mattheei TaxID=31246 RepID=A0AA85BDM0_9TREM|nr:unnamed protein product [Schistosoma mattheei]
MQRDDCKKWYQKMCTCLSPMAYKRCSKPNSHWLCMFCCTDKKVLIQEAMGLLALAYKKNDDTCADNTGTDSDGCVSVVPAVTRRLKQPTLTDTKVRSPLTLTRGVIPPGTDIDNNAPLVGTDELDKTITVPNSSNVLRDEK